MRERAAYLLSEFLAWGLVPLAVIREEAPLGVGSLQWLIECDFQEHYFTLYEDVPETHRELARIALFDYVANNRPVRRRAEDARPSSERFIALALTLRQHRLNAGGRP